MSLDFEFDDEIEVKGLPSRSNLIKKLKEKKLLDYGTLITVPLTEEITGFKREETPPDKWQFVLLGLREVIRSEGFYVTSRNRDDKLYILMPHEMPAYNQAKNKAVLRNLKTRQRGLYMINQQLLEEEDRKKVEFEILKNSSIELEMIQRTKERCSFK